MRLRSFYFAVVAAALWIGVAAFPARSQENSMGASAPASTLGVEVRHIHIRVMDVARTKAFYHDKLGFTVTNETPTVVEFPGLWFGKWTGTGPIPTGGITIGLATKSVEATYAELKKRGIELPKAPAPEHGEWSFTFKDPDGYGIEVEGPK